MKISWNWMKDLVEIDADPHEAARKLTFAGLEVEGVAELGNDFAGVVVAQVVSKRAHPKSAKLTLVTVDDGAGPTEVVCGAPNVPDAGGKVLWARPGSRLPDGRILAIKEVAGVASPGMLCSETELGLGEGADGIIILSGEDADARPGTAAQDALGLRDWVLDVNVTANRPDCLSHLGIARELAALFGAKLTLPDVSLEGVTSQEDLGRISVVTDAADCPRFTTRIIDGVKTAPSPRWMRRRLEAVGVRPISNLVDVTNYVMFELGQPLHAYDLDHVHGGLTVRRAHEGESLTTLDGQGRVLLATDLLICDERGPVGIAGVMGGHGSEVTPGTTRVLLEAAAFEPKTVRRTARRLGLHSEASHRNERGVDPAAVARASARAARLLTQVSPGARVRATMGDIYGEPRQPAVVTLRAPRVAALLGIELPRATIAAHLRSIELVVRDDGELFHVTCPTFRPDLEREVDLIEEVARLHGFGDIPATLPPTQVAQASAPERLDERVRDALCAAGLDESIGYGFTSPSRIAALRFPPEHAVARPLHVKNPMRDEQAVMRTSLLPNLLGALAHNLSFGQPEVRLFEVGHVFLDAGKQLPDEPLLCAGVIAGDRPAWLKPAGEVDFYDLKGILERLFGMLRLSVEFLPARVENGFLHPGVAAQILVGTRHVGMLGEVHPETADKLGIERRCFAFELNLSNLPPVPYTQLRAINRFPSVVRDVSFFCDDYLPAQHVRAIVDQDKPPILEELRILEDYREVGKVPAGKKGMLWTMVYRGDGRTLTDQEVDAAHETLVARLLKDLKAERR